jgi:hypothetical protein
VKVAAFLAAVEAICWLFGVMSIRRGNSYRFYYDVLASQIEANLPTESRAPPTGWRMPGNGSERAHPDSHFRPCGSAWGGSFTFGDDVADADAWPRVLSGKLGCEVANFGVDGFGFDQTLLLFQEQQPHDSIVILGMAQPMITVSAWASWTFIELKDQLPQARTTKPFVTLEDGRLQLHGRPAATVDAILAHYRSDEIGAGWTALRFPFSAAVALAIYRKQARPNLLGFGPMDPRPDIARQRELANHTIARMAELAKANGNRFVVLLIPRPEDAVTPSPTFAAMFADLAKRVPEACLIDPSSELKAAALSLERPEDIMTKTSHFATAGHIALAEAVSRGLAACRINP